MVTCFCSLCKAQFRRIDIMSGSFKPGKSSMYLIVWLNFLVFLCQFLHVRDAYLKWKRNRLANCGAQSVPIGIPTICLYTLLPTLMYMYIFSMRYSIHSINLLLSLMHVNSVSDQCALLFLSITYMPTVPDFPGLSRKLGYCPGVPENVRKSRKKQYRSYRTIRW